MSRPSTSLLSTRSVGGLNRAALLRTLVAHGPSSRSELARLANVTRATIGTIIQGLLDDGLLEELGAVTGGGVGKPARPVWFAAGAGTVAALELRRSAVRAALVDASGRLDHLIVVALRDRRDPRSVRVAVLEAVAELCRRRSVIGVGVAVPGTCDTRAGVVFGSVQVPGAVEADLAPAITESTGLPVRIDNYTRAEALAEHWFGKGRRISTFATVHTGDGLGAGIVTDGLIHRGPKGYGGEIGHTAVVIDGERCPCGKRGCWETVAALRWLRRTAQRRGLAGARTLDSSRLVALAAGDRAAEALLEEYADHLAIGIANLHQTLGIESFIIHGDASRGGPTLLRLLNTAIQRRATGRVDCELTQLAEAPLLGAAGIVLSDILHTVTAA